MRVAGPRPRPPKKTHPPGPPPCREGGVKRWGGVTHPLLRKPAPPPCREGGGFDPPQLPRRDGAIPRRAARGDDRVPRRPRVAVLAAIGVVRRDRLRTA